MTRLCVMVSDEQQNFGLDVMVSLGDIAVATHADGSLLSLYEMRHHCSKQPLVQTSSGEVRTGHRRPFFKRDEEL